MKKIQSDDVSYKTFQDILTGYRLSNTLKVAHESGMFDIIGEKALSSAEICKETGWDEQMGERFLFALSGLGFLENNNGHFSLAPISSRFLLRTSEFYQGRSIAFENHLIDSWALLKPTLSKGERVYSVEDKSKEEYRKSLELYLDAMHDAAKIRAREVFDNINPGHSGTILDAGAGSGAFLCDFLKQNKNWQGIFCDLKDVIAITGGKPEMQDLSERLSYIEVNLLEEKPITNDIRADILVLSNLVHCQGGSETDSILSNLVDLVADDGVILIHDFFSDCGWRGSLYDIHMMLNTYNGRTYSIEEMSTMLSKYHFDHTKTIQLESYSTLLLASRQAVPTEFIGIHS